MERTISWPGSVISWSLRWLPVNLGAMTELQEEITVLSQELAGYILSPDAQPEGKNLELFNRALNWRCDG